MKVLLYDDLDGAVGGSEFEWGWSWCFWGGVSSVQ